MTARRTRRPPIVIAGVEVPAGRRARIELPTPNLANGSPLSMPVEIVHGLRTGPVAWLSGAIHGDELTGVEVVRRVLSRIRRDRIRGTLIAVPVVNVFGFLTGSRYLPDRRDLNRSFPGSARGSLAAQLAHLFMREVVSRSEVGIDLHSGSDDRTNLPQIRADLDDPETFRLARAFGAPLMIHAGLRDGSLREAAARQGVRVLVYEGGEPRRFTAEAVEAGARGVLRVLRGLGMLETPSNGGNGSAEPPGSVEAPRVSRSTAWTRAGRSGIVRLDVALGATVRKGEPLGFIADAFGTRRLKVRAGTDGMVIGMTRNPLVNRGDALVHIARLDPPT